MPFLQSLTLPNETLYKIPVLNVYQRSIVRIPQRHNTLLFQLMPYSSDLTGIVYSFIQIYNNENTLLDSYKLTINIDEGEILNAFINNFDSSFTIIDDNRLYHNKVVLCTKGDDIQVIGVGIGRQHFPNPDTLRYEQRTIFLGNGSIPEEFEVITGGAPDFSEEIVAPLTLENNTNILSGSDTPDSSIGKQGDIYVQYGTTTTS